MFNSSLWILSLSLYLTLACTYESYSLENGDLGVDLVDPIRLGETSSMRTQSVLDSSMSITDLALPDADRSDAPFLDLSVLDSSRLDAFGSSPFDLGSVDSDSDLSMNGSPSNLDQFIHDLFLPLDLGFTDHSVRCDPELEQCDGLDNDCDQKVDEDIQCECGPDLRCYGGPPQTQNVGQCIDGSRICDERGESWLECSEWVGPEDEECDGVDNDCDGQTDEGVLNQCGECAPEIIEECDLIDNDCDGQIDEGVCFIQDLDLDEDCLTVSCPNQAPHPIACTVNFDGDDPRGCIAFRPGRSSVYFQEGNRCGFGRVTGTLTCSTRPSSNGLNEMNCPMNKPVRLYTNDRNRCPFTN